MSLAAVLKQADIFYEMTQGQLELVSSISTEREYQSGDIIFEENSKSDELYVVAAGEVAIQVDPSLVGAPNSVGPQTIAVFRIGQSFGEMAVIDEGRRSATARCLHGSARLVVIPREKLISLCETYPELGYRLMYNLCLDLSMKIRNADLQIREQLTWSKQN